MWTANLKYVSDSSQKDLPILTRTPPARPPQLLPPLLTPTAALWCGEIRLPVWSGQVGIQWGHRGRTDSSHQQVCDRKLPGILDSKIIVATLLFWGVLE